MTFPPPGVRAKITWYAIRAYPSEEVDGLFVRLAGDQPPGALLLRWNRTQWVNGNASCSRYLTWGEPGAEEVSQTEATIVLESLGGSMDDALERFAEVATNLRRQWVEMQREAAEDQARRS